MMVDFTAEDHGSIFLLVPHTSEARDWAADHIDASATRWGRDAVVVEHRFIGAIVEGAAADGLVVEVR